MAEPEGHKAGCEPGERVTRLLAVVDSDKSHLHYTSILLQRLEYNIYTTKTAEDALELVTVAPPALILTEINLSGMGGFELLKKIRRNKVASANPVFILTTSKDPAIKDACLRENILRSRSILMSSFLPFRKRLRQFPANLSGSIPAST